MKTPPLFKAAALTLAVHLSFSPVVVSAEFQLNAEGNYQPVLPLEEIQASPEAETEALMNEFFSAGEAALSPVLGENLKTFSSEELESLGYTAIRTLEELQNMGTDINYYLANDIDASETIHWNGGKGFAPVGEGPESGGGIHGKFEGNGHKITGLYINRPDEDYVGLFSAVAHGSVNNVRLENVSITGRNKTGALAGYVFLGKIMNSSVEGGSVKGIDRVGGLAGEIYNGRGVVSSHTSVAVTAEGDEAGGIAGRLWDGRINDVIQSYALGPVTGRNAVGGIAGYVKSGDLIRSYAKGDVTGETRVGGLAGQTTENAGIRDSYYSEGKVSGEAGSTGGIAGFFDSYHDGISRTYFAGGTTGGGFIGNYSRGGLADNYWDAGLNPGSEDSMIPGALEEIGGLSTAEMKTRQTYAGWDFSRVWTMNGYPEHDLDAVRNVVEAVFSNGTENITPLPLTWEGVFVRAAAYASADGSTAERRHPAQGAVSLKYSGVSEESYGGVYLQYDRPESAERESFDFTAAFPEGITFDMVLREGFLGDIHLELTDDDGVMASAVLRGLRPDTQMKWRIEPSVFSLSPINLTRIQNISIVSKGAVSGEADILWGSFLAGERFEVLPDAGSPSVTPLPELYTGERIEAAGFASQDGTVFTREVNSPEFLSLQYSGVSSQSYGGVYMNYGPYGPVDLKALYPEGLVIGLDNGGTPLSEAWLEITNSNGVKAQILLSGIDEEPRKWVLSSELMADLEESLSLSLSVTTELALVIKGIQENVRLNVEWGNFKFTPSLEADPSLTEADMTPLAPDALGQNPYLSIVAPDVFFPAVLVEAEVKEPRRAEFSYASENAEGFGGVFVHYDHSETWEVMESIDLSALYPQGIVFGLGVLEGAVPSEMVLEVKDAAGRQDFVHLTGLSAETKWWKVLPEAFDEADITQITTITFLMKGAGQNKFELRWGDFSRRLDFHAALTDEAITPIEDLQGRAVEATAFSSSYAATEAEILSASVLQIQYSAEDPLSYGGTYMYLGGHGNVDLKTMLPGGLVLGLDNGGSGLSEAYLEILDAGFNRASIKISGIESFQKKWKVSQEIFSRIEADLPVDLSRVRQIVLVIKGQYEDVRLNVDWGRFSFVERAAFDPALNKEDITPLPLRADGKRVLPFFPGLQGLNESPVVQPSESVIKIKDLSAAEAVFSYDLPETWETVETIDLASLFPEGMVFQLRGDPAPSEVVFEIHDSRRVSQHIILEGVGAEPKLWRVPLSLFADIDVSKAAYITIKARAEEKGDFEIEWGPFARREIVLAQAENSGTLAVTPLPPLAGGRPVEVRSYSGPYGEVLNAQVLSQTFVVLEYTGDPWSYGGIYMSYDDPATEFDRESINLREEFPAGIVVQLDNGGTNLDEAYIEMADVNGVKAHVRLTGLEAFGKKWEISPEILSELEDSISIDLARILELNVVIKGFHENVRLNVDWGNFEFTPVIAPDFAAGPEDMTPLPRNSLGRRVEPYPLGLLPPGTAGSLVLDQGSSTVLSFGYDTEDPSAFGGVFFHYDIPETFETESIDLAALFPEGMVFGAAALEGRLPGDSITLELKDNAGRQDAVVLTGLDDHFEKWWRVSPALFDGVDITQIQTITFIVKGAAQTPVIINWGPFAFTPEGEPAADELTDFGPYEPSLGKVQPCFVFESPCVSGDFLTVPSLVRNGGDSYVFQYDLTENANQNGRLFAGTYLGFNEKPFDLTAGPLVLELKSDAFYLSVEFNDSSGRRITARLNPPHGEARRYKFTQAMLGEADAEGFNFSAIVNIAVLVTAADDPSGTVEVRGKKIVTPEDPANAGPRAVLLGAQRRLELVNQILDEDIAKTRLEIERLRQLPNPLSRKDRLLLQSLQKELSSLLRFETLSVNLGRQIIRILDRLSAQGTVSEQFLEWLVKNAAALEGHVVMGDVQR